MSLNFSGYISIVAFVMSAISLGLSLFVSNFVKSLSHCIKSLTDTIPPLSKSVEKFAKVIPPPAPYWDKEQRMVVRHSQDEVQ